MSPDLDDLVVRYGDARAAAAKAATDPQAIPHMAETGRLRRAIRVAVATTAGNSPDVERIPSPRPPLAGHVHDDRCPRQTGVSDDIYLCGYRPRFVGRGEQR